VVAREETGRNDCEWVENWIYPGTHWILYNRKRFPIAMIHKQKEGGFFWVVNPYSASKRLCGYSDTLENAMKTIENILNHAITQLFLPFY